MRDFRCYQQVELNLSAGVNVFVGPNASGKTSLVEAILVLATTKSPRTTSDRQLVRWEASWGAVSGEFHCDRGSLVSISVMLRGPAEQAEAPDASLPSVLTTPKRIEMNGVVRDSVLQVIGQAPAVLFSPDDLQLVKGEPKVRRRFLNTAISQLTPRYLDDLLRYRRALRQRNELLKQMQAGQASGRDLAPWTTQLVQTGARISADREQFIGALSQEAADLHAALSGQTERLRLRYDSVLNGADDPEQRAVAFREALERSHQQETQRGVTVVGPQRDEMVIEVDGYSVRQFASQGQQRTAALSLKLAEARVMQQRHGESPVLLLDDCLSELDSHRARQVLAVAEQFEQTLLTSAGIDQVLRESNCSAWWEIADGHISQR